MVDIFDDGLNAEELAIALGLADEIAEEERYRREWLQEDESVVPGEDELEWFEKD